MPSIFQIRGHEMHATVSAEPDLPITSKPVGPNLYINQGENFVLVRFPAHMAANVAMIADIINSDSRQIESPVANLASFYGEAVARSVDPETYVMHPTGAVAVSLVSALALALDIDGAAQDAVERRSVGS